MKTVIGVTSNKGFSCGCL